MDRERFISYVEGNQESLRRYLIALCSGDSRLADDIAQETFIKAYLASDSFYNESKFLSWIYKIAYHTFLNICRNSNAVEPIESIKDQDYLYDEDPEFRYQHLYLALDRLSRRDKNVVLLFYLQGYKSKEIAAIMGISDQMVRQILSRSRKILKNLIKKYE